MAGRSATAAPSPSPPPPENEEEVTLDGVDLAGDDVASDGTTSDDGTAGVTEEVEAATPQGAEGAGVGAESPKLTAAQLARAAREAAKEEARRAREVKAEREKRLKELHDATRAEAEADTEARAEKRLEFLQASAEIFSHFMSAPSSGTTRRRSGKARGGAGGRSASGGAAGKEGSSPSRARGRMTEAQEDEQLLSAAKDEKDHFTKLTVQPPNIKFGKMRDYQLEGLNWLIRLHDAGISGILADEMGLGKTLQSISLLAYLSHFRGINGPHLVIVPKSTLGNWCREFRRWCPSLSVLRLHAQTKEERQRIVREELLSMKYNVVVTSYEVVLIEKAALRKFHWRYIVIDEAHRIKNEKSALSREVRRFESESRLLITGTPLQNNLHELWALLNFLLPDVFSDAETFDEWFDTGMQEQVVKKLHSVLRPFLLRRLKADVEKSLLPKKEVKLYVGMSPLQREWYKKVLSKDATALNALGGTDRVRLLNILMQLRKVCNHPYLFDGAEPGPPYTNGSHIWESCGKMVLLDRLLPKLKAQGSRVLIFCQMTRMLDILEDYLTIRDYAYSRIDGNTNGEDRDERMDQFNAPGSELFCFLLSTRAGGLGINLATADIVILYDSDWNPQMDLQAMDRAHRIGQKKQVRVFRLITEKTVEEKIIERAEKKLYLDAVVIQQGRLLEKNSSLSKGELMTMVRFGADEVFRSSESTISDADIDAILRDGEERTAAMAEKVKADMQHNLQNFSLDGGDTSIFEYEGEDYREKQAETKGFKPTATFIALPQRERKQNYDVNDYFRKKLTADGGGERGPRMIKPPPMQDYQFFDTKRIEEIVAHENELLMARRELKVKLKEALSREKEARKSRIRDLASVRMREGMAGPEAQEAAIAEVEKEEAEPGALRSREIQEEIDALRLPKEEEEEKQRLIDESFSQWRRSDVRVLLNAAEKYGRANPTAIIAETAELVEMDVEDVRRYWEVWQERGPELADYERCIERIEKGEARLQRTARFTEIIRRKVREAEEAGENPWTSLKVMPSSARNKTYTEEEDRFLVVVMDRVGYGNWEAIRREIRRAWQFRFDWYIKSRTAAELQKRCDQLVRYLEKEQNKRDAEAAADGDGVSESVDGADGAGSETSRATKQSKSSKKPSAKKRKAAGSGTKKKSKRSRA